MPILVDDKPIEIRIRYVDRSYAGGAVGVKIFANKEEEQKWVEKENKRRSEKTMELKALKKEVPKNIEKNAQDEIKELVTFWRRVDWGTQAEIIQDSQTLSDSGETRTDWTKYRRSQMQHLMVGWDLKTSEGEVIPINETILKRLDFNIALALIAKYEDTVSPSNDELENLE